MTRTRLSPQDLQHLRELAAQWGKIVARHAFGDQGPALDVDFNALEEAAVEAAGGLTESTLAALLERQAQALGAEQPCPGCGLLCPVGREPRTVHIRGGQPIHLTEAVCHCPACRRDFFPPAADPAPGRPRLQSRRPAPDR